LAAPRFSRERIRDDQTFYKTAEVLKRHNSYAKVAGALVLVCADEGPDERTAAQVG
jgi:hypothetical protein